MVNTIPKRGNWHILRKCFYPSPNVDSAVIKMTRRDNLDDLISFDHFERLVNADALGKTRPFLYFIPVFFVGFLPWSFHFIGAIVDFFRKKLFKDKYVLFFAIYFIIIFGLFSVASGKLPTYVLPAVPPAAFLTAYFIYAKDLKWLKNSNSILNEYGYSNVLYIKRNDIISKL